MPGLPFEIHGANREIFSIRHKEHIHAIRNNNSYSGHSNHVLNTKHTYGITTDPMDVIRAGKCLGQNVAFIKS
jgi:hypothetical protein